LTEPFVLSRSWKLDPIVQIPPTPEPCSPAAEVARLDGTGAVPHILPGAETLYPEYRKKLQAIYVRPEKCIRYCCGWEGRDAVDTLKDCIGDYRQTPGLSLPSQGLDK